MTGRTAHPKVEKLIVERWSPRAFDGGEIPQEDLDVIFEAAGWAPSAYNVQPWTFLYARRGDAHWDIFMAQLVEFNQGWAKDASALVFVVSDKYMRSDKGNADNHSHSFDAGSAWMLAALQAQALGDHTHGMTGIKFGEAEAALGDRGTSMPVTADAPFGWIGWQQAVALLGLERLQPVVRSVFARGLTDFLDARAALAQHDGLLRVAHDVDRLGYLHAAVVEFFPLFVFAGDFINFAHLLVIICQVG
jgi:nitroreductase